MGEKQPEGDVMDAGREPLLVANWKMNNLWEECESFTARLRELQPQYFVPEADALPNLVICPPFPYIILLGSLLDETSVFLGAQDVSRFAEGAYTGDVSAAMLDDLGCDFAIVGHSERRGVFGETDDVVSQKLARLREAEITPILCVGEALAEREAQRAVEFTLGQLEAVVEELKQLPPDGLAIAYEPIWAIGTGRNAEPADAQEMAAAIRGWLEQRLGERHALLTPLLYGGSVKPANIAAYFELQDIDGALVGGASLKAESFAQLVDACVAPSA
jgi:triosephosphate isomerase